MKFDCDDENIPFSSPCSSRVALFELAQFSSRNSKFRHATIHADNKLRKNPHDWLVNILQPEKMDAHLRAEFLLVG